MRQYWIGVASKEHVEKGVKGKFAQVCHGKVGPLSKMKEGDWLVYYSPMMEFRSQEPCQCFTVIGIIKPGHPYLFEMSPDFISWRRDVSFLKSKEISIRPLIKSLAFIQNKSKWGFPFQRGCFQISQEDFNIIAEGMGIHGWKNL